MVAFAPSSGWGSRLWPGRGVRGGLALSLGRPDSLRVILQLQAIGTSFQDSRPYWLAGARRTCFLNDNWPPDELHD